MRDAKRPFVLKQTEREDDTLLHKAIREALTNLVIHADYMITGVLRVEKHDDRLFFSNPGSLKLPIADIYKGGNSKARNPHIQSMLRMLGYGDNIGSGFPTIVDVCQKENWRKPFLCESDALHTVELTISMKSLISEECRHQLRMILGSKAYQSLNNEEILVLSVALSEDAVTNSELQTLLGRNSLQVGKVLYSLVERNILISQSRGRWTSYELNKDYIQSAESRSKSQGVRAQKSRSRSQKILDFCKTPRTLSEIAKELNLSDRYNMKRRYIDPLLEGGSLSMLEANKTAPTQKYIAVRVTISKE